MAARYSMSSEQCAVLTAHTFSLKRPLDRVEMLQVASRYLGRNMTAPEFLKVEKSLIDGDALIKDDKGISSILLSSVSRKKRDSKNFHLGAAKQLATEQLWLYNDSLQSATGEKYVILFNCDGNGSSKLPDGSVVNINLNTLSRQIHAARNVQIKGQGGGGDQWVVDLDYHKNAPPQVKRRRVRNYVNEFYP